jgi:cobalt-zinc-cadmium efflux system outer membrane protein
MDRHLAGRTWWFAPSLLLLGCASTGRSATAPTTPDVESIEPMVDDSAATSRADDRTLTGAWLERAAYVGAVLHRNRGIESARQAWRAATGQARQSGSFEDPMVSVEVAPLSIGSSSARVGWDAAVSQRLPWPGKLALDEAAAHAEADAAKSDFEAARRELALTASLLFDQYFVDVRSIEINVRHLDLMRNMQAAVAVQYASGRGTAEDSLQAEFELARIERDTVTLAAQRDVTVAQMNELLHRAPESALPPPPANLPDPSAGDRDARGVEADAVDRRPDVVALHDHARAAQAHVDRASRESMPDVTLSTSFNSMWDTPEHRWMVGLAFNLPVWTGRRAGAVDEAKAMRARYEADAAQRTDAARTQVAVALRQLEESNGVLGLFEQRLLPVARHQIDAALAAFTASRAPFVSVIEAERNLRGVELDRQVALADHDRRRAELDHALGRMPGLDGSEVAR